MQVKMITPEARPFFRHLISPGTYQLMEQGEPVTALGLLYKNVPIGAVAGMINENDIFTVMSLYVAEEHRRKGGGSMLIDTLEVLLEETESGIAMLSYVEDPEDEDRNNVFFRFMESLGMYETTSLEHLYEIPLGSFYTTALFPKDYKSRFVKPFSEMTAREKETFIVQYKSRKNEWMGKWFSSLKPDPELSFVRLKENMILGYLLFENSKSDDKEAVIIISRDSDATDTASLLSALVSVCRNKFPPDIKVLLPVRDDRYERLFGQLRDARNLQHNYIF